MLRRQKATLFENVQLSACNYVTMGIQFDDPELVPSIIKKFKQEIVGLNIRYENGYFIERNKHINTIQLPKVDDLKSLTQYVVYHSKPNHEESCGELYYNDDSIILRLNHALADGKYLVGILDHISDSPKMLDKPFPTDFVSEFAHELNERRKSPQIYIDEIDQYSKITKKCGSLGGPELLGEIVFDVKSFQNYNKQTRKCTNITPSITTGYSLGILAFEGLRKDNIYKIGGPMVVDMRPEMKSKPTLNTNNMYSIVPSGSIVNGNITIRDVFQNLRKKVRDAFIDKSRLFDSPDSIINHSGDRPKRESILPFFSQLGMVNIKSPIRDIIIYDRNYNDILFNETHIISYQIVDERNDRNEFHFFHRYNTNGISGWQSNLLLNSLKHFLQTFDENMTVHEALDDLKRFQQQFIKI